MDYELLMNKARKTNNARDKLDNLSSDPIDIQIRAAMQACACGIEMQDWNCVAEGIAMLEVIHLKLVGKDYKAHMAKSLPPNLLKAAKLLAEAYENGKL